MGHIFFFFFSSLIVVTTFLSLVTHVIHIFLEMEHPKLDTTLLQALLLPE